MIAHQYHYPNGKLMDSPTTPFIECRSCGSVELASNGECENCRAPLWITRTVRRPKPQTRSSNKKKTTKTYYWPKKTKKTVPKKVQQSMNFEAAQVSSGLPKSTEEEEGMQLCNLHQELPVKVHVPKEKVI
jgi:hypothetical protein